MIKQSLLSTNLFLENDYFLDYVELIEINLKTKKERFVTQQHHIIPRCYYIHNNLTIDNKLKRAFITGVKYDLYDKDFGEKSVILFPDKIRGYITIVV